VVDGVFSIPLSGQPPDGDWGTSQGKDPGPLLPCFVVGPENRLVEVAVRAVLEDPPLQAMSPCCNPLVLYGPPGTGKSHLARGLAGTLAARCGTRVVVYTTAVDFSRELADAIQAQAVSEFRRRNRRACLLVMEDIGYLVGKDAAQQELIYTLDAIVQAGNRIVLTTASAPALLPKIAPGLRSRLTAGLSVPLVPPGANARLVILQQLAALREMNLPEPSSRMLADALSVTVPQLLGALIELEKQAKSNGGLVDVQMTQQYLAERNGPGQVALQEIAAMTARSFSLRAPLLRGPSRRRTVVTARGVAMYLARQLTASSLRQIGHYFGGRDHTTVRHACRKTENLLKIEPTIRESVQRLRDKLQVLPAARNPENRRENPARV